MFRSLFAVLVLAIATLQGASVAVVGGGSAGLVSAWLLEQEHDVTLYEKQDRLGGHAYTVQVMLNGNSYPIDAGFEFFSDEMFPTFNKLLTILNVPTHSFALDYTFFTPDGKKAVVLPPIVDGKIKWESFLPGNLADLIQLKIALMEGKKVVDCQNRTITLEEFASHALLCQDFCYSFFYPFLAGAWLVSVDDIKGFAAYDLLKWLINNAPANFSAANWNEVVGGTSTYIQALVNQFENTTINLSASITSINYQNGEYSITLTDGSTAVYDQLIIATNAQDALSLISNIPNTEMAQGLLGLVEYHPTTIALHGDTSYMPEDQKLWSLINILSDETGPVSTIYKPWESPLELPIFKSCVTSQATLPDPLYATIQFFHPDVTPNYFEAQEGIHVLQGNNSLWFAGVQTYDTDSHESAILSAVFIAQNLSPTSVRLQALLTNS